MKNKLFILVTLTSLAITAQAKGIRYVEYNRDNIPNIITAAGIASEIIFEDDETIEYATFGFDAAWESATVRNHILVFKAKDEQPETNLIVHTDKRDYLFTVTTGNNEWTQNPNNSGAYYSVRMVYHDDKSKAALAAKAAKEEEEGTLRNRDITPFTYVHTNYDYRATDNARDIVPTRVWDNGTLTFLAFRPGSKRGVAYELVDERASLVNQHTEKNGLLIIHGVYPKLIIRLGDQAVVLRRNDQGGHRENISKTNVIKTTRYTSNSAPTSFKESTNSFFSPSNISIDNSEDIDDEIIYPTEAAGAD